MTAYNGLKDELTQFLQASSPDWVIYDFAPYWLPQIAAELAISRDFFNVVNTCFDPRTKLEDFTVPPKWILSFSNLAHRYYEIKWIVKAAQNITSDVLDTYRLGSAIVGCNVLATRDCEEFEAHCGWSSIIEGLQFGHTLIMLPFMVEQGLNARIFEKNKVGIEISRDDRDGLLYRNSVVESLKLVITDDKGKVYRDKAREMIYLVTNFDMAII
ncbi:putative UDP-rhamnose:rhamnosyltransferase 1 [Camellia sinensis]|uniref:putative UDP-rhamnose:rhamnosyltransferase 1 n=1 Tax=Camellia sinensis TaxID=4442 RepID=UPI001035B235|nr:putative UDP-rhamnose:rhamnosyltransferase 1 [Camellia sinensis]